MPVIAESHQRPSVPSTGWRGCWSRCAVASLGVALVASALLANQRWLDRHFLPSLFLPRQLTC